MIRWHSITSTMPNSIRIKPLRVLTDTLLCAEKVSKSCANDEVGSNVLKLLEALVAVMTTSDK